MIIDKKMRESLVEWMKRGDKPAPLMKALKVVAPLKTAAAPPRYVQLAIWATTVFGEHAPHKNTLLRWVHDGRIQPQPKKIGRTW